MASPSTRLTRPAAVAGLLLALWAVPGCLVMDKCKSCVGVAPPPPSPPCQAVMTWSHKVQMAPDPVHNGVPSPGLMGRLYLFDEQVKDPMLGDGGIFVELFDDSGPQPGGLKIEEWTIDKDTLKRLARKDTFGMGYTLFLPWGSYRTNLSKVHLALRYDPENGSPLFAEPASFTIDHSDGPAVRTTSATIPPGASQNLHMPRQTP
ncbi:MAG TPA: hypothetical protein VL371_05200 [Gemmataceae bacterium]|jgi:hypothetical protein|nr:hypothetical protein [Gemmataceae bacterium]